MSDTTVLAELSIWPLDEGGISQDVARIKSALDQTGVDYEVGAMGTTLQGTWSEVMDAVRACHETAAVGHPRVLTSLIIDDRRDAPQSITESKASVHRSLEPTR